MTDRPQIDVSIIVVSYNTCKMTLDALRSVKSETHGVNYELLVVDNNSTDGSKSAIAEHHPDVDLVALSKNIGFAAANNLAATKAQGRYLLLLNPDTVIMEGAIDRLLEFANANQEAKIWGGRTFFGDGTLNPSSCWHRMTLWNTFCRATGLTGLFSSSEIFNAETFGNWQRDVVRPVDIVSGCFFLIKREFWNKLGGFDPAFFMYGEEADLCLRAKSYGARPMITPYAVIVHYGGASETTRSSKLIKLLSAKAALIKRHFPNQQKSAGLFLLLVWPLSRWLVLRAASLVTRNQKLNDKAQTWHTVWQQREQWRDGWPTSTTADTDTIENRSTLPIGASVSSVNS